MTRTLPALLLVAGLAAGLTACAVATPPLAAGPERQQRELSDAEVDALATILRLEDHRRYDADVFGALARDPSEEVRRRTAMAVGRIGDPAGVPLLLELLGRDPQAAVRADAAFAIGLMGDTSAVVHDALRAAAPRDWVPVREEETTVVVEAVGALGRLGTDRARSQVVDALRRTYGGPDVHSRRVAAEALLAVWKFTAGPGRVLSAARFLDHPEPGLRWRAALALVRLGDAEAAPRLLQALDDPDPRVRALAARGVPASLADQAGIGDAALDRLVTATQDPHPHVRINALRSLAGFEERAPLEVMAAALRDRDPHVPIAAAEALRSLGPPALEVLYALVGDDAVPAAVRAAALPGLADLDPDRAHPVIAAWAERDRAHRYAAARALAALGWPRSADLIETLAADPDPRVAVAATDAAAALAAEPGPDDRDRAALRALLLRFAEAGDPRQRVPALRGLAHVAGPEDVPALLDVYGATEGDEAPRPAAIAAIRTLGALRDAGAPAADAFFRRFQRPADRWVVRAAAEALGDGWGEPPAAVVAEELEFYRDVVRLLVAPAMATDHRPLAAIGTPHGEIRVEMLAEEAPLTVYNFIQLANAGVYDHGVWHRVVPNFVLQDGAPAGDPTGGPGWSIRDEINRVRYGRGILGMALAGPDTGGSQWFITHSPQPHLDGGYTVFGRVIAGERAMDRVVQGDDVLSVRIR